MPAVDICRVHAEWSITLHKYFLDATIMNKIIDIRGSPGSLQGGIDVGNGKTKGAGLFVVDVNLVLRNIFKTVGSHSDQC